MIYLIMFTLSCCSLYASTKYKSWIKPLLVVVALSLPCAMAAFRGLDVGTDVKVYAIYAYRDAATLPLPDYLNSYLDIAGVGYSLLTWLSARLFHSFQLYLGILQLAVVVPVYCASRKINPGYEWASMLIYYLLLYALTLNAMKQSIALAICYLAFAFLLDGRKWGYVIAVVVACLFHQTAIVFLIVYPCYQIFVNGGAEAGILTERRQKIFLAVMVSAVALVFIAGPQLVRALSVLKDSYAYQVEHIGDGELNESALVLLAAAALNFNWCRRDLAVAPFEGEDGRAQTLYVKKIYAFSFVMFTLGLVLMQLNVVADSLGRFGYYFLLFGGAFLGAQMAAGGKRSHVGSLLVIMIFLAYFIFAFLIMKGGEVYPYETWVGNVFY